MLLYYWLNTHLSDTCVTNSADHSFDPDKLCSRKIVLELDLDMTDHCITDFCIWRTICLVQVRCISSIRHMYTTDFAYDGQFSWSHWVCHIQVHLYSLSTLPPKVLVTRANDCSSCKYLTWASAMVERSRRSASEMLSACRVDKSFRVVSA